MPMIETPSELADWLADQIGVWGAPERCEWVSDVEARIRQAVKNENRLHRAPEGRDDD